MKWAHLVEMKPFDGCGFLADRRKGLRSRGERAKLLARHTHGNDLHRYGIQDLGLAARRTQKPLIPLSRSRGPAPSKGPTLRAPPGRSRLLTIRPAAQFMRFSISSRIAYGCCQAARGVG